MNRRAVATVVLAAQAGFATSAGGAVPRGTDRWVRVRTEHFTLYGNGAPNRVERVGSSLELLRQVLAATSTGVRWDSSVPTAVFVFKNSSAFAPYKAGPNGEPRNVDGYFVATPDGNYVALDASADPSAAMSIVYHEYLHDFLASNVPGIPLWLNEGLAEVYSSFATTSRGAEIGIPVDRHLYWLTHHPWIRLEDLFTIDRSSSDYNEGERQGTFYAQSWALVHFLLVGDDDRRARFARLLHLANAGTAGAAAIAEAYGLDLSTLEGELRRYVHGGSFHQYAYESARGLTTERGIVEPIDRAEILVRLGDLLAHYDPSRPDSAREHLEAALALEPGRADAWASLAWIELAGGRSAEAMKLGETAVRHAATNGRAQGILGRSLLGAAASSPGGAADLLERARAAFRASLASTPERADSWIGLAQACVGVRDRAEEGLAAAKRGFELAPGRSDAVFALVALTAESGDLDGARDLLDGRRRSLGDPAATRAAEAAVVRAALARASELAADGRVDEATQDVTAIAGWVRDPEIRLSALRAVSELRAVPDPAAAQQAAHAASEARESHDRLVDLYNDAVRAVGAGELERGTELLERVARETDRDDLRAKAQAGIAEVREAQRQRRLSARFNEAVGLANAGRRSEAIRILEELRGQDPSDSLRLEIDKTLRLLGA